MSLGRNRGNAINILLTLLAVAVSATTVLPGSNVPELGHIDKQVVTQTQPLKVDALPQPLPKAETVVEKPQAAPSTASSGGDIENIVRQAARKHGVNEEQLLRVARCESTLNPNAVNEDYFDNGHPSGLFQHLSGYFPARAAKYGYPGGNVFDPVVNANVTAAMFRDGLQGLWECK